MPISLEESVRPQPIPGGVIPEQTGEKIVKNIEQLEAEAQKIILDTELKPEKPAQDEAVLSEESKSPREAERVRAGMLSWSLEDSPLWRLLLNWNPLANGGALDTKLQQLIELYQALLQEVLANTSGPNQTEQLFRLESALSTALNRFLDANLEELNKFFDSFGSKEQFEQIKSELYRAVTGHRPSAKELKEFMRLGDERNRPRDVAGKAADGNGFKEGNRGNSLKGGDARQWNSYTSLNKQSVIYQPGKKSGTILTESFPSIPGKLDQKNASPNHLSPNHGRLSMQHVNQAKPSILGEITIKDMKLSKQFISYLQSEQNVLAVKGFGGKSEELKGVLASILQIQCREFSDGSKMGDTMSRMLFDGVDHYIDKEIHREEQAVNSQYLRQDNTAKQSRPFQYNNVYKVYCHILGLYEQYHKPDRAISEGIRYAVETFQQKSSGKADTDEQDIRFFKIGNIQNQEAFWADLKAGKMLLEKNWGHFLSYTSQDGRLRGQIICLVPLDKGFWGMCVKPEVIDLPEFYKRYFYLFLGILVIGLILLFLLRF